MYVPGQPSDHLTIEQYLLLDENGEFFDGQQLNTMIEKLNY